MKPFEFILGALAVWRITHLLAAEDGPFNLIAGIRHQAGSGFWGTLLDCFYCLSIWIAVPFALLLARPWKQRLLLWLALSAAAIVVNRVLDRIAPDQPVFFEEPAEKIKEEA
ncbi:MAG TPA: DUF1360 domain-containing protein [Candidatus Angelobacter sp.]